MGRKRLGRCNKCGNKNTLDNFRAVYLVAKEDDLDKVREYEYNKEGD